MYVRLPVLESYIRLFQVTDVRLDLQRLHRGICLIRETPETTTPRLDGALCVQAPITSWRLVQQVLQQRLPWLGP